MATATRSKTKKAPPQPPQRRIVEGIEHGLSGYTNYGCRCDVCTESNRAQSRSYRDKKFAGEPLCVVPRCPHKQARSYGNGLCWNHAKKYLSMRDRIYRLSRSQLRRIIKANNLPVRVLKRNSDEEIAAMVVEAIGPLRLARMARS